MGVDARIGGVRGTADAGHVVRHAARSRRQGVRRLTGFLSLMAFPITLNFFSPFVSQVGAWQGVVAGSVILFAGLFVSAVVIGRSFCAWVCPAGACQDIIRPARDQRVVKGQWVKYLIWAPWFGFLALGLWRHRPVSMEPLFLTEGGVSVSEAVQFIPYFGVVVIFVGLALAVGRRGACHTLCWMAPFMIIGRRLGSFLRIPALRLRARPEACTSCGTCTAKCPMSLSATAMAKSGTMEHDDCILCGECVDACPEGVLRFGFGRIDRTTV